MFEGVNYKDALKLFWAIQWRWVLIYYALAIPLFALKTIPHGKGLEVLYQFIDLALIFTASYICIVILLKKGYGTFQLKIVNKENET